MSREDLERSLESFGWAPVLVTLDEPTPEPVAATRRSTRRADPTRVLRHLLAEVPPEPRGATAATRRAARPLPTPPYYPPRIYPRLGVALGAVDRAGLGDLDRDPTVRETHSADVELSLIRPVARRAVRRKARFSWGLRKLGIPALWEQGLTGAGVRVGHLDTGVDGEHPALAGRIAEFLEVDLGGERVPGARPRDSGDHGTHTAGTICGERVGRRAFGVAPGAELFSGLVIEGNPMARVLEGLEWILEKEVRILNLSLGFRGFHPFLLEITSRLRQAGVLPVFAIGNEGRGTSRSPGNYPLALSVGASDRRDRIASFSSSQTFDRPEEPSQPNVVAPGVSIISAKPGGRLQCLNGTSMATPHVAGVAALLFEAVPGATVAQVEHALQSTARPLRGDPERFGFGLIDPAAALATLTASP